MKTNVEIENLGKCESCYEDLGYILTGLFTCATC